MRYFLMFSVLLVCLACHADVRSAKEAVDQKLTHLTHTKKIPGVAVALVHRNRTLLLKGYGVRNMNRPGKVTRDTLFRLSSLSKTLTGALMAKLKHQRAFRWDQKVVSFLPHFKLQMPAHTQALTLEHILTHRVGLPHHTGDDEIEITHQPFHQVLKVLETTTPTCMPGVKYEYQNVTFSLTKPIIYKATGRTYETQLQVQLARPLGMRHLTADYQVFLNSNNRADRHLTKKIRNQQKKVIKKERSASVSPGYYHEYLPAGGLIASIADLNIWLHTMMGYRPEVLSKDVIQDVLKARVVSRLNPKYRSRLPRLNNNRYGLGWRIGDYETMTLYWHTGSVNGYHSLIAFIPQSQLGIAMLANNNTRQLLPTMALYLDTALSLSAPAKDVNVVRKN